MSFALSNLIIGNGGSTVKDSGIPITQVGGTGYSTSGTLNITTISNLVTTVPHNLGRTPINITFRLSTSKLINSQTPRLIGCWNNSGNFCLYSNAYAYIDVVPVIVGYHLTSSTYALLVYFSTNESNKIYGTVTADNINFYITWNQTGSANTGNNIIWTAFI